jgi:Flp pilus assembly protein TadB
MTSLFTTRTSQGRTDDEKGSRSVVRLILVVLAAIVLIAIGAAVGFAPTIVGGVAAVVAVLIAALTFVWAAVRAQ